MTIGDLALNKEMSRITADCEQGTFYIGFVKATINRTDIAEKINGSMAGFAVQTQITCVVNATVIFCARLWDEGEGCISIPTLFQKVAEDVPRLERRRAERLAGIELTCTEFDFKGQINKISAELDRLKGDPSRHKVRVLRTENHAHLIEVSRDRKIAEKQVPDVDKFTYGDLVDFSTSSVNLVDRIRYLWDQTIIGSNDRINRMEKNSSNYWNAMPKLDEYDSSV